MQQQIIHLLTQIVATLQDINQRIADLSLPVKTEQEQTDLQPALERLYSKQQVMAYMGISSSTYHRYKIEGIIIANRIGKRDFVKHSALQAALRESIRKGKV